MLRKNLLLRTLACGSLTAVVIAFAGSVAQGQAGISVTFPSRVAAAPDYPTDVLGDPWDMCNPEDISPFPMELVGFSNFAFATTPCRAGGIINAADSSVAFLYRGNSVAVNPGRNGRNFPIDTSKYQILSYKLNSNLAGQTPQIYWYHNSFQDPGGNDFGVRYAPATINGTQIAAVNLATTTDQGSPWASGSVAGFRFDPNNINAGQNVSFRWVRLTSAAGAVQPITWSGGSGNTTIALRDNSDGTMLTIASGALSSPYNWNYGYLAPGSYTLTVTRGAASGTAAFTINAPPTIEVTDPSPTTGEDFATKVLGNPWDMSDAGDLQITGVEHTTAPTFSGGVAYATNNTNDPNVTLLYPTNNAVPIDPNKYRYLTYRLAVDGPFDLGAGSMARVLWSSQNYLNATSTTTSTDVLVWPGWNTYTVDLASLSIAGGGILNTGEAQAWTASVKRNLRLDPHEFWQARTFWIDDVKLTAKPVAAGSYTIRFAGGDANGDPTTVALYYDTDTNPANGKTLIASGLAVGAGQFGWSTNGVPQGEYYIYAEAWDGLQATGRYSAVPIQVAASVGQTRRGDFDGDGRADMVVYRPSNGTWYSLQSSTGSTTSTVRQWGLNGDIAVPGDYDGDGRTDPAVYRPSSGTWFLLQSSTNYTTNINRQWGIGGDIPKPGDYDGDGKTDMAVFRPSNASWYILQSSNGWVIVRQWGLTGDIPKPGDYDGDGKTDMAVYRPSNGSWYLLQSSTNSTTSIVRQWGLPGDIPAPGDFDGDRRADMTVYRPSNGSWYILYSSTNSTTAGVQQWGLNGDTPMPGDYDGDGRTDMTVYRPSNGTWYILQSSTGSVVVKQWGMNGDLPSVEN